MVVEQKQAVTEVARSLGINDGNLRRWIREQDEKKEMSFPGKGQQALTPDQQRIKELEAENRQLKMEQEILKKATAFFGERPVVRFAFIQQEKEAYPVQVLCKVMQVGRSGFYRWQNQQEHQKDSLAKQFRLDSDAQQIFIDSDRSYGSRRMAKALQGKGYNIGRYQAATLMKRLGLVVKYAKKFKVTTNSKHKLPVAENLLNREFAVTEANRVYTTDITYLWTREGWLYLAVVMDLYSRKIVGWSMDKRMTTELPLEALRMAWWSRKPGSGVLHHSDQGSQYASLDYQAQLREYGMICSMSRKGNCWDNAVTERFFGSMKRERTDHYIFETRADVEATVVDYILFYNNRRLHSYLGYMSPVDFEQQELRKAA
ncbi:IS3 family transposase [Endozoicomonas sp. SCSIO W0465]|uniref:IS3 family transposase n=1 Tax=Endozoicomonas sp. SCSIO W0465 TaxID=2918516 RepID=UPI002075A894|nr:IS3 family transposase [Endozoicomonas sp. SCSIO W0465]USE39617.1 IS3 family transposase [Endozoicomonas sp. SCSIO W0465]USE39825.1 IS3 family transposase [Endozoicomonas sp. SCSIO W0465]